MNPLRWSLAQVLFAGMAWLLTSFLILPWPLVALLRQASLEAQRGGVSAVSGGIASVLIRVGLVFVPPLLLLVAWWLNHRR